MKVQKISLLFLFFCSWIFFYLKNISLGHFPALVSKCSVKYRMDNADEVQLRSEEIDRADFHIYANRGNNTLTTHTTLGAFKTISFI